MARVLNTIGLIVGIVALALQFGLTIPASMEAGRSLIASIIFYFSFFTILTNLGAVLAHAAALTGWPAAFAHPAMHGGVAVAISVVALVYWALLSSIWEPQGLFLLCDVLLHYATPAIFVLWWLLAGRDGSLSLRHVAVWLLYPIAYAAYVLVRAPIAGEVPYPFLDATISGWTSVFVTIFGIAILFTMIGILALAADRMAARRRTARQRT
ncbi:Pr6Pr family membrane protein [Nitratireductor indicus]|uniref:Pr6Pr family membrane protein n=1 Tax=Nitratireductor indicus TaxID=721133 RepID=UPI0002ECEFAF|nr:Pr6Pr family membrane protein [Nitratireductor indicus]SFQ74287.1 hypothetical protein SAMN05216176_112117 [Nitratireductor indicus]